MKKLCVSSCKLSPQRGDTRSEQIARDSKTLIGHSRLGRSDGKWGCPTKFPSHQRVVRACDREFANGTRLSTPPSFPFEERGDDRSRKVTLASLSLSLVFLGAHRVWEDDNAPVASRPIRGYALAAPGNSPLHERPLLSSPTKIRHRRIDIPTPVILSPRRVFFSFAREGRDGSIGLFFPRSVENRVEEKDKG